MIINNSYFLNKSVYIPHAVAQPSIGGNTPNSVTQLQQEIDEREFEFLVMAFGYDYAKTIIDNMELVSPATEYTVKASAPQSVKDLVNGVEYDEKKWNGLRYTLGTKKISLIAFYVFFYYLGSDFSTYSTTGVQVAEAENSIRQNPNGKQTTAWNRFIEMYGGNECGRWLNYNFSQNWNGTMLRWFGNNNRNEISLWQFMQDKQPTYETKYFTPQSLINIYNL